MIQFFPELGIVTMSLVDLEHCHFDHDAFDAELWMRGIGDERAKCPVMMVVNFGGGCIITPDTQETTLEKMRDMNAIFEEYMTRIRNPTVTSTNLTGKPLLNALAALEHDQWVHWSKNLARDQEIEPERLERWKRLWKTPYKDLTAKEKSDDLRWARYVVETVAEHLTPPGGEFRIYGHREKPE